MRMKEENRCFVQRRQKYTLLARPLSRVPSTISMEIKHGIVIKLKSDLSPYQAYFAKVRQATYEYIVSQTLSNLWKKRMLQKIY